MAMKRTIKVTVTEMEAVAVAKRAKEQGRSIASYIRGLVLQDIPALAKEISHGGA